METQLAAALATLERTPVLLTQALELLPLAFAESVSDGDWSPKHLVAHLMISEQTGAIASVRSNRHQ